MDKVAEEVDSVNAAIVAALPMPDNGTNVAQTVDSAAIATPPTVAEHDGVLKADTSISDEAAAPPAADDRAAFLTLLEAWGGLRTKVTFSWSPDKELSEWEGITVGDKGRATKLILGYFLLTGATKRLT